MDITLRSTSQKYEKMVDELVPPLIELLKAIDELECEIFKRNEELEEEKIVLKISPNQIHPKWSELVEEHKKRFEILIGSKVSEKLMARGYARSFGKPGEYFYATSGEYNAEFTMRKPDVASIILHYKRGLDMKHKFVMRLSHDKWLIDEKYYGYNDKTWYLGHM